MTTLKAKGYDIQVPTIKDSHYRRAVRFANKISFALHRLGLIEDDVDIEIEKVCIKRIPAKATWYFNGQNMEYSYGQARNFVENLYVVSRIIELEVEKLVNEEISLDDFTNMFTEDTDVEEQRKEARKVLGVSEEEMDLEVISKAYKQLAKTHHPDMDAGNHDLFKKINKAHKMLKRELE